MDAQKKSRKNPLVDFYLIFYNFVSALGYFFKFKKDFIWLILIKRWVYVLYLTVKTALSWKSQQDFMISKNLYSITRDVLKILLASAGLEVFHAAFRLVPSNPMVVFPQVFIRFLVIWAVADVFSTVILK